MATRINGFLGTGTGTRRSTSSHVGKGDPKVTLYYGVVQDNRVELEGDAGLANGVRVEVRTRIDEASDTQIEEALIRCLRAEGLIEEPPVSDGADDNEEMLEPVMVQGELLSEQIIRERR